MTDIKKRAHGLPAHAEARNVAALAATTGNIYEALAIIAKRATQLSKNIKGELHNKLEEFAVNTENLEEIHENKEQIEISKFYERLPNPPLIAIHEYIEGKLHYHYINQDGDKDNQ